MHERMKAICEVYRQSNSGRSGVIGWDELEEFGMKRVRWLGAWVGRVVCAYVYYYIR